jgi:hypothetical protein
MKVYIALPYGRRRGNSVSECEANVKIAIEVARQLILRGHIPFIPHLYHYVHTDWDLTPHEDEWLKICKAWIPFCDALLRPPGDSWGADREVEEAIIHNVAVFYSLEEIPKQA